MPGTELCGAWRFFFGCGIDQYVLFRENFLRKMFHVEHLLEKKISYFLYGKTGDAALSAERQRLLFHLELLYPPLLIAFF